MAQQPARRCSREMEMSELEAEASLKECAMLQRILQHRQSGSGGGTSNSLESLLMQSPPLFQPTNTNATTTATTTAKTSSSATSTSLHQILCGIDKSDDPALDEDNGDYPNDDNDSDDGVFVLDM
jgi:hypothetical protein